MTQGRNAFFMMLFSALCIACRLRLYQVCRAWNKELHAGAAAAAAWQTLSLSRHLGNSIGIVGQEGLMAAWAIRHRDFVRKLIILRGFSDDWVMVSMLDTTCGAPAVSTLCCLACYNALETGIFLLITPVLPQALGPWLTAVESILTGQCSNLRQ